jgi:hypothetical protein
MFIFLPFTRCHSSGLAGFAGLAGSFFVIEFLTCLTPGFRREGDCSADHRSSATSDSSVKVLRGAMKLRDMGALLAEHAANAMPNRNYKYLQKDRETAEVARSKNYTETQKKRAPKNPP